MSWWEALLTVRGPQLLLFVWRRHSRLSRNSNVNLFSLLTELNHSANKWLEKMTWRNNVSQCWVIPIHRLDIGLLSWRLYDSTASHSLSHSQQLAEAAMQDTDPSHTRIRWWGGHGVKGSVTLASTPEQQTCSTSWVTAWTHKNCCSSCRCCHGLGCWAAVGGPVDPSAGGTLWIIFYSTSN